MGPAALNQIAAFQSKMLVVPGEYWYGVGELFIGKPLINGLPNENGRDRWQQRLRERSRAKKKGLNRISVSAKNACHLCLDAESAEA